MDDVHKVVLKKTVEDNDFLFGRRLFYQPYY